MIDAARRVTGSAVPIEFGDRRPGDPPILIASAGKIERELGWRAKVTDLDEIIASAWNWFRRRPEGYADRSNATS